MSRRSRSSGGIAMAAACAALLGCAGEAPDAGPGVPAAGRPAPLLADVTADSGVVFVHRNDASERRLLAETMGSGLALFDYDGDGWCDVYLVDGGGFAANAEPPSPGALYRNLGGNRFVNVTRKSGLDSGLAGMGAAVADVDGNGWLDLLVTGVGEDRLYLNEGGRFHRAGEAWRLSEPGYGTSAAFFDYDGDGWLDLFVGRYVEWSPAVDQPCLPDGEHRVYCTPEIYPGQSNRLYRNLGGAGFSDVTERAGLLRPEGKTLGVAVLDLEGDGRPDLAIANDTVRNFLYHNLGDGTFEEIAVEAGFAFSSSGAPRGGMGIAAADLTGDGRDEVVIGNFSQEMSALYRATGDGLFRDVAASAGIGLPTLMTLAFGTAIVDLDRDGALDIVIANGHIEPEIAATFEGQSYAQPLQLFLNRGEGRFEPFVPTASDALADAWVARALGTADLDRDGDPDLVLTQNGRPARLLRNGAGGQHWIGLELDPHGGGAPGWGAAVRVTTGAGERSAYLASGGSYLTESEPLIDLSFAAGESVRSIELRWPSGRRQRLLAPALGRRYRLAPTAP